MKSNLQLFWMKLHAYLACFFLPFTIIYLSTGVLHLFDIHGSIKNTYEYEISLPNGWPEQELTAEKLVMQFMVNEDLLPLPDIYYSEDHLHDWYDRKREIALVYMDSRSHAKIIIKEHDLWMQLMFIHKGIAGNLFWVLGLLFGLQLLISAISGIVMVLKLPGLKTISMLSLFGGVLLLIMMLLI